MSIYLHDIPLNEAQARWQTALEEAGLWRPLDSEEIALDEKALGRVLAASVWAKISSPHYHASAMDGFALRAADTTGAQPSVPRRLACAYPDGQPQAAYLDTGDPLPEWADAVLPIELAEPQDENGYPASDPRKPWAIQIRSAITPWSHVRPIGEDIVATQLVLPIGHRLRPVDLGAIAACGHSTLSVVCKPRVAVLPTGNELKPISAPVEKGDIIEYNSLVLAAQVNSWDGAAVRFPITIDRFDLICEQVKRAAESSDLVLLNAGSSAGAEDFSARVVEALGELLIHGVAVRPGHPVILGMLDSQKWQPAGSQRRFIPIIGVPGYPVSAALTGEIFVEPLLSIWQGKSPAEPDTISATLTHKVNSPAGDDDYLRVAVGRVGDKLLAAPLARGSGMITSLVKADGISILPRGVQGLPAGAEIQVRLYRPRSELEKTIFAVGSHDITLDLLAQFLAEKNRRLASANVGSLGGLVALRRGEAHLAGSHLLDPQTGEYNLSYIRQYLPDTPVKLISLVGREQGLLIQRGNPKRITSLQDLARPEVIFVNRQKGAGTRVLLEYHLGLLGINPTMIRGFQQEEYTHLAVAAAVASGRADCGLGIAAAAQALELDFIPLFKESYELVTPAMYYSDPLLSPLWDILLTSTFRGAVSALPGYDVSRMGQLIAEF